MKQLPYGVQTDKQILLPAKRWCQSQWGPRWEAVDYRDGTWTVFWAGVDHRDRYQWWFETEEQRIWFTLRWDTL